MKILTFIAALFSAIGAFAQFGQGDEVMLVNGTRKLQPYQNKLKFDFGFDARRTFLQRKWIDVGGLRVGAQYRRVHRLGIGFYFLNTRLFSRDFDFPIDEDLVEYEFGYTALYYERTLYFDRKWEISAGLQVGGGNVSVMYNPGGRNDRVKYTDIPFSTAEISLYGEYHFLYWLGAGAGVGYRGVTDLGAGVSESFSGPIVLFKIQVKLFKLARGFFDPEVKYEH